MRACVQRVCSDHRTSRFSCRGEISTHDRIFPLKTLGCNSKKVIFQYFSVGEKQLSLTTASVNSLKLPDHLKKRNQVDFC